jgi:hypothetical protein
MLNTKFSSQAQLISGVKVHLLCPSHIPHQQLGTLDANPHPVRARLEEKRQLLKDWIRSGRERKDNC